MTLGAIRRDTRQMSHGMESLAARVAILEDNARRSFVRLLIWSCASAAVSSALIFMVFR